jgi:hypothetical protein
MGRTRRYLGAHGGTWARQRGFCAGIDGLFTNRGAGISRLRAFIGYYECRA